MESANARYPRSARGQLAADLALYPVVAVMGARQVGKSTLCLELAREFGFTARTLDDRDMRQRAQADPEGHKR